MGIKLPKRGHEFVKLDLHRASEMKSPPTGSVGE
jgi:hypothetical protein